jgi:hypothetical protein
MGENEINELVQIHDNGKVTIPEAIRLAVAKWKVRGFAKFVREVRGSLDKKHGKIGAMCALGVLDYTIKGDSWNAWADGSTLVKRLVRALGVEDKEFSFEGAYYSDGASSKLANWNNDPNLTHEQAMQEMLDAADKIEKEDMVKN